MKRLMRTTILLALFSPASQAKAWDCSKLAIQKFQFAGDCVTKGVERGQDPRDNSVEINRNCFVSIGVGKKSETIHFFLSPAPDWAAQISISPQCDGSKGLSASSLGNECRVTLIQSRKDPELSARCECSQFGCGQRLVRVKSVDKKSIRKTLAGFVEVLSDRCDISFGKLATNARKGETSFYASSVNCPFAELGALRSCDESAPEGLSFDGREIAVACVPMVPTGAAKRQ